MITISFVYCVLMGGGGVVEVRRGREVWMRSPTASWQRGGGSPAATAFSLVNSKAQALNSKPPFPLLFFNIKKRKKISFVFARLIKP